MEELLICNQLVTGSSPVGGSVIYCEESVGSLIGLISQSASVRFRSSQQIGV